MNLRKGSEKNEDEIRPSAEMDDEYPSKLLIESHDPYIRIPSNVIPNSLRHR